MEPFLKKVFAFHRISLAKKKVISFSFWVGGGCQEETVGDCYIQ